MWRASTRIVGRSLVGTNSGLSFTQSSPSRWLIARRYILSDAVARRVQIMVSRHEDILKEIDESPNTAFTHGKELASLRHIVLLHEKNVNLDTEEISLTELMGEASQAGDPDMEEECREEVEALKETRQKLERRFRDAILPKDENDFASDAIVEIRAGTGGDEASIFASELREAYEKSAKAMRWEFEVLSESRTDLGGIKETVLSIAGRGGGHGDYGAIDDDDDEEEDFRSAIGPYGLFKYESGVHRVQRVPVNDTRIHTSACSVAALPLLRDSGNSKGLLPMSELKIETMRSSGAGGQHVNCTDSAVRVTHIPTGITASIQDERSQHKNKDKALKLIAARVRDQQRAEEEKKLGATKSSLMGGGDRSERIRTYNYPQDRVTDHRCKHTTYGISKLLDGSSDDGLVVTFYPFLRDMVREEQLAALEEEQ
jgi:peptide chain release factor 1